MPIKSPSQVRTPSGGMNQDDSVITPNAATNAGLKNSFQLGDYRYALNARIGSSRGDNFGDLENLKGTVPSTDYFAFQSIVNLNSSFATGSLAYWGQNTTQPPPPPSGVVPVTSWLYGTRGLFTGAYIDFTNLYFSSTLYGAYVLAVGQQFNATYSFGLYNNGGPATQFFFNVYIVYLDNSGVKITETLVQQVRITGGTPTNTTSTTLSLTAPVDCANIGFRIDYYNAQSGIAQYFTLIFTQFRVSYTKIVSGTPPSGTNKVIGKYEDNEFQRIYKAIWNSNNDHTISYYDPYVDATYELLRWSGLNFQSDYFVKMAKLDNWLAFTDRNNPPRLIDTNSIANLFSILGTDFREFHISFHKWAPTAPPIPRVFYDNVTNNYEVLKNKIYHFSYRYVYYGNLRSRWSPISKGAVTTTCGNYYDPAGNKITSIEVDLPGVFFDDPASVASYNYFDHSDIKFKSAVKSIELAFNDGEIELWKLWKTIDVTANYNRYQYFDGTGNLTPLADEDFTQLFDTVPFKAGTVEAVDNRFVFGDCLDEQEPATGLSVTDVAIVTDPPEDWQDSFAAAFSTLSPTPRADILRKNALSAFNFKDRGIYKVGIQWLHRTGWRSAIYTTDDWTYSPLDTSITSTNRSLGFNFTLNVTPPEWAVGYQIFRTNVLNISYFLFGIVNSFQFLIDNPSAIIDSSSLPEDVKNRIRQHFENSDLVTGSQLIAAATTETNASIAADASKHKNWNNFLKQNAKIGRTATLGAPDLTSKLLEKYLSKNSIAGKLIQELRLTQKVISLANCSRIYIDINNWYFGAKKSGTLTAPTAEWPLNKLYYNYRTGDRLRFTGSNQATNPSTASQLKEYDVPIIEFTGKGIIIEKPTDLLWIQGSSPVNGVYYYNIEVYTPKIPTNLDHIFYEVGEWYPVLYPGTSNRVVSKSDFKYTNNAAVTTSTYGPFNFFNKIPFFYADAYIIPKVIYRDSVGGSLPQSLGINISMNPDPDQTFGFWDHNDGRVAPSYQNLPIFQFKKTQARFGGRIVEQSFVNNLNNFFDDDQFIYPSEYGRIRNIINTSNAQVESVGSILLMIGEREAWSVYVNRTTLEDLSGRTQVSLSDQVLGSYNSLLGSHGTLNPESVCSYRGNIYWWDAINGSWVRYGRDGLTPISDYKMRNWFKELGSLLINLYSSAELPRVISEFDPFNMELVTYFEHSSLPATFRGYPTYKGMNFSESDNRWKNAHSYTPEMFSKLNNQLYSFWSGIILKHEYSPVYSTFNGVKYDVQWEPVFNDESNYIKSWQGFAQVVTDKWSVERILSEYRGLNTKQQSRIAIGKFVDREDNFYADIPRDLNTPNIPNPLIEGNKMRSKAIQVLMQLDPAVVTLSLLHYVYAECIDSPKNP